MSLLRYLVRQREQEKLPRLKRHLTSAEAWTGEITPEVNLILMRGVWRDPVRAQAWLDQHGGDVQAALRALPVPKRPDWRKRLKAWLMTLEGSSASPPGKKDDLDALRDLGLK